MGNDVCLVEGRKDYRLSFQIEAGKAAAFEVLWYDGTSDRFQRVSRAMIREPVTDRSVSEDGGRDRASKPMPQKKESLPAPAE